jgi:uncharacterized alpha-E superfamily protein
MILSRVAERIYWAARYLQRVESSARIVNAYTNLLMDLPREVNISWFNLVTLNNGEEEYDTRYKVRDERNVVKFTLVDDTNASSMLGSLSQVRENFRTTRDVVPENAWEMINELSSFAHESISNGGLNRAKRDEFLTQVINQCQMIQGYVASTMSHDAIWHIWRIGRAIERADMTTRLLEAGASILLDRSVSGQIQTPSIIWGNVLRSSSADHAYRRAVSSRVEGKEVPNFLLFNDLFPRSVNFCLREVEKSVKKLPKQRKIMETFSELAPLMESSVLQINAGADLDESFLLYINKLQIQLANLHQSFVETWFSLD